MFDASPGGPSPEALRGPFDSMVSIPPIRPALSGSVFLGWRSGSGRLYDAGEEYTLRFSETLVAAWAPDEADLLVRDLVLDPGTLKPGQEGRAAFVLLGTNRINPYADVPVAILFDGEELGRVRATPEPGVPLTLSVPFCPGQVPPGEHRFCVTADPDGVLRDDDRSNNSAQTVLTIESVHETRLSWVACPGEILPGRSFYVSCMLYNEGTPDILPTDGERLEMVLGTASDGAVLEVQTSAGAAVPSGGSNFYWFLLRCPEDLTPGAGLYVRLSFRFGDEREENPGNQRLLSVVRVRGETGWQAGREGYFAHPPASYSGIPTPRVEPFYTSSRWTVWEWDGDRGFFPVTYGVNFVLYSFFTDLQGRARKEFASGEGFGLKVTLSPCGLPDAVFDRAFLQGPCEMCLTYPEHGYAGEDGKSDSLSPVSGSWFLPGNVHFIPLYLPDGQYGILLTLSGLSSPLGMLGGTVRLPGLTLKGSLYDRYTFGSTSA
ncbi:MAG: hypothetical protein IJU20_03700 [Clostridia bacterium]|nr:hypothetical protein [Clostridia bacterium]